MMVRLVNGWPAGFYYHKFVVIPTYNFSHRQSTAHRADREKIGAGEYIFLPRVGERGELGTLLWGGPSTILQDPNLLFTHIESFIILSRSCTIGSIASFSSKCPPVPPFLACYNFQDPHVLHSESQSIAASKVPKRLLQSQRRIRSYGYGTVRWERRQCISGGNPLPLQNPKDPSFLSFNVG